MIWPVLNLQRWIKDKEKHYKHRETFCECSVVKETHLVLLHRNLMYFLLCFILLKLLKHLWCATSGPEITRREKERQRQEVSSEHLQNLTAEGLSAIPLPSKSVRDMIVMNPANILKIYFHAKGLDNDIV